MSYSMALRVWISAMAFLALTGGVAVAKGITPLPFLLVALIATVFCGLSAASGPETSEDGFADFCANARAAVPIAVQHAEEREKAGLPPCTCRVCERARRCS